jgi:ABC-type branched-subunit amino acid transport system permease subunit
MSRDPTIPALALLFVVLAVVAPFLPSWLIFLLTIAFAKGLVALGLMVMMRSGLVSFGQGLYYGLGAYAAGLATNFLNITDAFVLVALGGIVSALTGAALGLVMARYREIFFAMLSLALSMILYGILVRSSALGSTDGFNLPTPTFLGFVAEGAAGRRILYVLAAAVAIGTAMALHRFIRSPAGVMGEAILSNEIRVEYLGTSVAGVLYLTYMLGAVAAGLGGALVALAAGHIDPDLAYWTTSGEFVFVAILSGTGHVAAPLLGMAIFEAIRSFAFQYLPYTWQMVVGVAMLAVILFLPMGLWSLFTRTRRARGIA